MGDIVLNFNLGIKCSISLIAWRFTASADNPSAIIIDKVIFFSGQSFSFFMLISLGVLAFYAIQQVAQAGWSPLLFRVMQGITAYLPVGSVIFFVLLIL